MGGRFVFLFLRQVTEATPAVEKYMGAAAGGLAVSVWTTTPWTLPSNLAVAVSETIEYSVVEHSSLGARYVGAVCCRSVGCN